MATMATMTKITDGSSEEPRGTGSREATGSTPYLSVPGSARSVLPGAATGARTRLLVRGVLPAANNPVKSPSPLSWLSGVGSRGGRHPDGANPQAPGRDSRRRAGSRRPSGRAGQDREARCRPDDASASGSAPAPTGTSTPSWRAPPVPTAGWRRHPPVPGAPGWPCWPRGVAGGTTRPPTCGPPSGPPAGAICTKPAGAPRRWPPTPRARWPCSSPRATTPRGGGAAPVERRRHRHLR